jgi:hypothetical protein
MVIMGPARSAGSVVSMIETVPDQPCRVLAKTLPTVPDPAEQPDRARNDP